MKEILKYTIALEPIIAIALTYLVPWDSNYSSLIQKISVSSIFWLWPVLLIGYMLILRERPMKIELIEDNDKPIIGESAKFSVLNRENILILYWLVQIVSPNLTSSIGLFEAPIHWFIMFFSYNSGFQALGNTIYYYRLKKLENIADADANIKFYNFYSFCLIIVPLLTIYRVYLANFDYPLSFMFMLGPCAFFFMMGWSVFDALYEKDNRVFPRFISVSYLILTVVMLFEFMRMGFINEFLYNNSFWSKLFIVNMIIIISFNFFTQNKNVLRVYLVWSLSYFNIFIYNIEMFTNEVYRNSSIFGVITLLMLAIMIPNTLNLVEHYTPHRTTSR